MGTPRTLRSWITTEERNDDTQEAAPDSPWRDLARGVPEASRALADRVARDLSVPPRRINEIVHGHRGVTADTALRLARYFSTSARFWLNLQARYDLEVENDRLGSRLRKEVS